MPVHCEHGKERDRVTSSAVPLWLRLDSDDAIERPTGEWMSQYQQ